MQEAVIVLIIAGAVLTLAGMLVLGFGEDRQRSAFGVLALIVGVGIVAGLVGFVIGANSHCP